MSPMTRGVRAADVGACFPASDCDVDGLPANERGPLPRNTRREWDLGLGGPRFDQKKEA